MGALLLFPVFIFFMTVGFFVMFIFALVGVLQNNFKGNEKIMWVFIVFIPLVGPLLYFTIGKSQIIKKEDSLYLGKDVSSGRSYRRSSKSLL